MNESTTSKIAELIDAHVKTREENAYVRGMKEGIAGLSQKIVSDTGSVMIKGRKHESRLKTESVSPINININLGHAQNKNPYRTPFRRRSKPIPPVTPVVEKPVVKKKTRTKKRKVYATDGGYMKNSIFREDRKRERSGYKF